jgi:superoxide dismutase, Cu-Zn family
MSPQQDAINQGDNQMPIKKSAAALGACSLVCLTVLGLRAPAVAQHDESAEGAVTKAVAVLFPTKGSDVKGRVTFTRDGKSILVHADISGLTPGEHGFHIHEFGVWSEDGLAAGSHFNPTMEPHAGPDSAKRHIGDLGNITANSNGHATLELKDSHLTFHGSHSIIGRGLVVHVKADDLKTQQPPGNAGGRLAVGVIGVAKP